MFAKIALAYLVVACAAFVWSSRAISRAQEDNPQIDAANRIAPRSVAMMLASISLLIAIFWPASLITTAVFHWLGKRAAKEIDHDDDDDGNAHQVT